MKLVEKETVLYLTTSKYSLAELEEGLKSAA